MRGCMNVIFISQRLFIYMYKMFTYIPIFTFYALELGRMLHVFYIASFSMYVDEWFIYANFQ